MKYKLAIFDLDGTILDTLEDISDAVNYVLLKYGYKKRSLEEIRNFLGYGGKNLITAAIDQEIPQDKFDEIYKCYIDYYSANCDIKTKPYDGIYEMLANLKKAGIKLAVVSNKGDKQVKILVENHFRDLFDFAHGERKNIKRKPHKEAIISIVEEFGFDVKECVYIGDSEVDILTAHNSSMDHNCRFWL
ncbi:MAG: HAD family hydrolase [Erysipelotrichaceae bacterium]|jgi:phosphoglycolate phosphatase